MQVPGPDDDAPRRRAPAVLAGFALSIALGLALAGAAGRLRGLPSTPPATPSPAAGAPGEVQLAGDAAAVAPQPAQAPAALAAPAAGIAAAPAPSKPISRFSAITVRLGRNQTLAQALLKLDLTVSQVNAVVASLKGLFPFHRARPGDQLRLERRDGDGELHRFSYRQGAADEWVVERLPDGSLQGSKRPVQLTTEVSRVAVTVDGSLWNSLERAGQDPELAVLAADALAFDVDFYQDLHPGDRIQMVVERVLADGKLLRYGDVLAAEWDGQAARKRLFRYTAPDGTTGYYDENGSSSRRGFLKSPLKFAHVTSGFGNRMHPLLGYRKQHEGVDYGAPTGTPVWSVADGQVREAGWKGACGKAVVVQHRNGLETVYCHLSAVAVSSGKPVSQKQVIGYVGTTGRSTGPHLHFAVRRDGHFVNPLKLQLPRDAPLAARYLADFREKIAP
ncbi:MAG TPA: M23 family metallopeptidase, partial [Anaeromyxobacteraceae bacterium]|nr:M23 family metallopeptidase [Anaeromyxobacteraceae bacterium]